MQLILPFRIIRKIDKLYHLQFVRLSNAWFDKGIAYLQHNVHCSGGCEAAEGLHQDLLSRLLNSMEYRKLKTSLPIACAAATSTS